MQLRKILGLCTAIGLFAVVSSVAAAPTTVTIADDRVFPESVTSTAAGDLIIGSYGKGTIYRAKAGSDTATPWLDPAKTGMVAEYGVYAHDASNTLYVCSITPPAWRNIPGDAKYVALRTFDLKTGEAKASYPMVDTDKSVCNDIDVDKDGNVYVSDMGIGQVLRLKKGAHDLEVWAKDDRLSGIDGIALGDHFVLVNSVATNRLFRIPIGANGAAGEIVELQPSLKLARPDGIRALGGNKFLMAENSLDVGRVTEVTVTGDKADIRVLKEDPGVSAITKVGNTIWVNNAQFGYLPTSRLKDQTPGPFVEYAIPFSPSAP